MKQLLLSLFASLTLFNTAWAGEISTNWRGIAIDGYDPVSYHTLGEAQQGDADISYEWKDATWRFASEEHKKLFVANPEKYAPAYGGHCANGLATDHKVDGNPELWRMIDGKVYLFFAPRGRKRWASNTDQWIQDANATWAKLKGD